MVEKQVQRSANVFGFSILLGILAFVLAGFTYKFFPDVSKSSDFAQWFAGSIGTSASIGTLFLLFTPL